MDPWYYGFQVIDFYCRVIVIMSEKKRFCEAINKIDPTHLVISELPIGISIEIELTPKQMQKAESDGFEKIFKLTSSITLSNMMCFDASGKLVKYESPKDILNEFYNVRIQFYVKRKVS